MIEKVRYNKINLKSSGEMLVRDVVGHLCRVDVDIEGISRTHATEILADQSRVDSDLQHKHANRFFSEIDLNREGVLAAGNVGCLDGGSRHVTADNAGLEYFVTFVVAIHSRFKKCFRQVVDPDVQDDLAPHSALPTRTEHNSIRHSPSATVLAIRRPTNTMVSTFHLTSAGTSITINRVAIVTSQHELLTVAAHLGT